MNLGFAQIYLSLMIDGIGSRPFSAVTIPPYRSAFARIAQRCSRTRAQFASKRAGIETAIFGKRALAGC